MGRIDALNENKSTEYKTRSRLQGLLGGIIDENRLAPNSPLSFDFPTVQSQCKLATVKKNEIIAGF
jgi:tRNA G26 N,N-dimethylase Trm1